MILTCYSHIISMQHTGTAEMFDSNSTMSEAERNFTHMRNVVAAANSNAGRAQPTQNIWGDPPVVAAQPQQQQVRSTYNFGYYG